MGARKKDKGNEPWIDNYPPLKAWVTRMMEEHNAHYAWQFPLGKTGALLDCLQVGSRCVLILVYPNKRGWEIWTSCGSNRIDETLADAERRLGLMEKEASES